MNGAENRADESRVCGMENQNNELKEAESSVELRGSCRAGVNACGFILMKDVFHTTYSLCF